MNIKKNRKSNGRRYNTTENWTILLLPASIFSVSLVVVVRSAKFLLSRNHGSYARTWVNLYLFYLQRFCFIKFNYMFHFQDYINGVWRYNLEMFLVNHMASLTVWYCVLCVSVRVFPNRHCRTAAVCPHG